MNAVHCWKLLFTYHSYVHELILCATSVLEEDHWKARISEAARPENAANVLADLIFLDRRIYPLGVCLEPPGTVTWRTEVKNILRSKKANARLVIIKNVSQSRETPDSPALSSFRRSHPRPSPGRIAAFAPEKSERTRLAQVLDGIWTKEILPFPDSAIHRSGNFIRASRNTVIRKLSKASTNTQSSKRSVSHKSLEDPFVARDDDQEAPTPDSNGPGSTSRARAKTVCTSFEAENAPDRPARSVTFEPVRKRGGSESTLIPPLEVKDSTDIAGKAKKPMALLKALSSDGIKKRLK